MRGFTNQEKIHIKEILLKEGKKSITNFGFKKTSIKELTDAAGIAQGSFYLFFQSKEELYFRLLEEEEEVIKSALMQDLSPPKTPKEFSAFLLKGIKLVQESRLIKQMYFEGDYERIVRKLPPEMIAAHIQEDHDLLLPLLKAWRLDQHIPSETLNGALRAFFIMALHSKEIGEEHYQQTLTFLAEAIALRLFQGEMKE